MRVAPRSREDPDDSGLHVRRLRLAASVINSLDPVRSSKRRGDPPRSCGVRQSFPVHPEGVSHQYFPALPRGKVDGWSLPVNGTL